MQEKGCSNGWIDCFIERKYEGQLVLNRESRGGGKSISSHYYFILLRFLGFIKDYAYLCAAKMNVFFGIDRQVESRY